MDSIRQPPLPADLETAHKELRYWQRQVILLREKIVSLVEKNELIRRSAAGNIKKLQQENQALRLEEQVRLLMKKKNET